MPQVVISVLDMWVITGVDLAVLKLLRVLRVFRLVRRNKTLKMMLATLAGAVTSIISALLFLFIWSVPRTPLHSVLCLCVCGSWHERAC